MSVPRNALNLLGGRYHILSLLGAGGSNRITTLDAPLMARLVLTD